MARSAAGVDEGIETAASFGRLKQSLSLLEPLRFGLRCGCRRNNDDQQRDLDSLRGESVAIGGEGMDRNIVFGPFFANRADVPVGTPNQVG